MDKRAAVLTGFKVLDELTGGLSGGQLILVGGRPAMGKSTFAMNIANHVRRQDKNCVAVFSLEMSEEQYIRRCTELDRATGQRESIYVVRALGITPGDVRKKLLDLQKRMNIALVVIDYIQLMSYADKKSTQSGETARIITELKKIAMETDLPIIVLSQLTRACEMRADRRPVISDFGDSVGISQILDVIFLLYREACYVGDHQNHLKYVVDDAKHMECPAVADNCADDAELIVAKHPSVAVLPAVVHLVFDPVEGFRNSK